MDILGQGPTIVTIFDPITNETIGWTEGVNKYMRRPSSPMDPLVMRLHAESMPKTASNSESLGTKAIDGHNCHGWRASGTEIWFDDDYGCPVVVNSGGTTTTMIQFSAQAPDPLLFQPPTGYVEQSTPLARRGHHSDNARIMRQVERLMH